MRHSMNSRSLPRGASHPGLSHRWTALWRRLGVLEIPAVAPLLARWQEPQRAYHTLTHLANCLAIYDRNPHHDARVELALWFHDAVYDPQAHDNEARSVKLAQTTMAAAGMNGEFQDTVCGCILATRHRDPPANTLEALTLDVDLAILGASRLRFTAYDRDIRREYAWVPWDTYCRERGRILTAFLARPHLYSTPWIHRRFAARARGNLSRAIRALEHDHG